MKKINILLTLLIVITVFICGCTDNNTVISDGKKVNTSKMQHKHCTRSATGDDITTELNYEIYYSGEKLNILESNERVISEKESNLDTYQEAYENINEYYKGLKYYDTQVVRGKNYVLRKTIINYDKINISTLLDIEGEEDNIIENGEAKVDLWLTLAKKFGTKCELVEE